MRFARVSVLIFPTKQAVKRQLAARWPHAESSSQATTAALSAGKDKNKTENFCTTPLWKAGTVCMLQELKKLLLSSKFFPFFPFISLFSNL